MFQQISFYLQVHLFLPKCIILFIEQTSRSQIFLINKNCKKISSGSNE
jgi:hypothetical protein